MDKESPSKTRQEVPKRTWEDSASEIIDIFDEYEHLKVLHYNITFGFDYGSTPQSFRAATNFEELRKKISLKKFRPMTIYVKDGKTKRFYGLEQRFSGILQAEDITKKPGFFYNWYKTSRVARDDSVIHEIMISRNLATRSPKVIKKQAVALLKECNRFYHTYMRVKIWISF